MIILSGIDIVNNKRIKKLIERSPETIKEMFSQIEIDYCNKKKYPEQSFGVRFAVKEALIKATNSDILEFELNQIETINTENRKPILKINNEKLNNRIRKLLDKDDFKINISLSHEKEYSIAQIIIY